MVELTGSSYYIIIKNKQMKKLLIVCLAFISGTAVFAQQGQRDRDYSYRSTSKNAPGYKNDGPGYSENQHYGKYDRRDNDYQHAPSNRRDNDYGQRNGRYGNQGFDKDCNNNRIPQRGRPQASGSLGKGIAIGDVAGIILGAVLSH